MCQIISSEISEIHHHPSSINRWKDKKRPPSISISYYYNIEAAAALPYLMVIIITAG